MKTRITSTAFDTEDREAYTQRRSTNRRIDASRLDLEEHVVHINRVSKVVKGGRRFSFSIMVVVGDGNGHVGVGMGKGGEVPEAIRKGVEAAKQNVIRVPLTKSTIPHDIETKFSSSRVRLLPAAPGTGVIAGHGVRPVIEAAGIKNILSKSYGSNNPINVVKATFQALSELTSIEEQSYMRGISVAELRQRQRRRKHVPSPARPEAIQAPPHAQPKPTDLFNKDSETDPIRHYTILHDTARQNTNIPQEIYALAYLASFAHAKGETVEARRQYTEALEKSNTLPDKQLRGILLGQLGLFEHANQNHVQALTYTLQSLVIFERLDMPERQNAIQNLTALRAVIGPTHFAEAWLSVFNNLSPADQVALDVSKLLAQTSPSDRITDIIYPERCQINQVAPLQIQLRLRESVEMIQQIAGLPVVHTLPVSPSSAELTVLVSSSAFDVDLSWRSLVLPFNGDSEQIQFELTARHLGLQTIDVQFFHQSARVGYTVIETEIVEDDTAGIDKQIVVMPVDDRNGTIKKETKQPPDIHLQAKLSTNGRIDLGFFERSFQNYIEAGSIEYDNNIETAITKLWENLTKDLSGIMKLDNPDPKEQRSIWERFEGIGRELGKTFLSSDLRRASKTWNRGSTIFISTKIHWIPWELIYDDDYWGRKFTIARYPTLNVGESEELAEIRKQEFMSTYLSKILNVVGSNLPEGDDKRAEELFVSLSSLSHPIILKSPGIVLDDIIENMISADVVHFTCHGLIDPCALLIDGRKDGTSITSLRPTDINICHNIRGSIIFANACNSAISASSIKEFYDFGVHFHIKDVSVYIGTLGEIPTKAAIIFANHFYKHLWDGNTVGESLNYAKAEMPQSDPFSLLYTIYGDPFERKAAATFDRLLANRSKI